MEKEEVKSKAVKGVVALTMRTVFLQGVSAVAFFLLGIFLSPSAVGVFIVVSSVLRIFTLFTDIGLGAALIQKKEALNEIDLKTAFTLQEILVGLVVVVSLLLSPLVSRIANLDSQGLFLYQVLAFTLFLSSLKVIPSILLERKLAFEKQVIPQIIESIVFNLVVVVAAYKGLGVASYSWAVLSSAIIGLPIYYLISPWKIGFGIEKTALKSLVSFGAQFQAKSFLAVLKDDLLTFFLSSQVGQSGIGFWGWASRWSYFPFRFIVDSVTKVTFPAYSRLQSDRDELGGVVEKSIFAVGALLFPVLVLMAFLFPQLVYQIPHYSKWVPAIVSFWFLCAAAGISGISNILVNVLDATGKVQTTLKLMILWIFLTWVLTIFLVSRVGFTGISIASFTVSLSIVLTIYLTKKEVNFRFVHSIYKQLIACVFMSFGIYAASVLFGGSLLALMIQGGLGGIIYLGIMGLLAGGEIKGLVVVLSRSRK